MIMRSSWLKAIVVVLVPALLLLGFPVTCQAGDNGSDGAAITVGLFATILVVLTLISLRTDVENVFTKAPANGADPRDDALVRRVSVVLDDMKMDRESVDLKSGSDLEVAGGIGLRMDF
jgi:hypothetical protein